MIAFDIDGCVNCIKEDLMRLGKDYFAPYHATFHEDGYYLREIYAGAPEEAYARFWELYGYDIYTAPPKEYVYETIQYVKQKGIPACYITTRDVNKTFGGQSFSKITEQWLEKYRIALPVYYRKDKDRAAQELQVELMVEDKPANILKLQHVTRVLIYKHPYNSNMQGEFVNNWQEIKERI